MENQHEVAEELRMLSYYPRHLVICPGLSFSEWEEKFQTIEQTHQSVNFWLGDMLLYGERDFGEDYSQVLDGRSERNLKQCMWVCSRIAPARRSEKLSYTSHRLIATLPPELQEQVIAQADKEDLRSDALKLLCDSVNPKPYKTKTRGYPSNNPPPDDFNPDEDLPMTPFAALPGPQRMIEYRGTVNGEQIPEWLRREAQAHTNGAGVASPSGTLRLVKKVEVPPPVLSKGLAAVKITRLRDLIEEVRHLAASLGPTSIPWNLKVSRPPIPPNARTPVEWITELRQNDKLAVGIGTNLPLAIAEAALCAAVDEISQE